MPAEAGEGRNTMDEHTDFREAAGPEDDVRAHARRALQDAYDWRDDEEQHPYAAAAASAGQVQETRSERAAARRLRGSTSRTVGV
jgi:hypothetical protein